MSKSHGKVEEKVTPDGPIQSEVIDDAMREALESVESHPEASREPSAGEASVHEGVTRELEEVKSLLELSTTRGRETLERLKETHDRYLRAAADLENYKKRTMREREEAERFCISQLVRELLPVLDNLDRALEHAGLSENGASLPKDAFTEGVVATRRLFEDTLAKFGVKAFASLGTSFDPNRHEAMQQLETEAQRPGTVARELTRGYLLHDRLLRPALVAVAVAPAKELSAPSVSTAEAEDPRGEGETAS